MNYFNKNISLIIIIIFISLSCKNDNNESTKSSKKSLKTQFYWKGDSLGNFYFSHSNMLFPVKLSNDSSETKYLSMYPGIGENHIYKFFATGFGKNYKSDSSKSHPDSIQLPALSIGEITHKPVTLPVFKRYSDSNDSIIGSISLDFFEKPFVEIDFTNKTLITKEETEINTENFIAFSIYLNRKILIPVKVNNINSNFLLNPQSALYVIFNTEDTGDSISIGKEKFKAPDNKNLNNSNPAFNGIIGYAFLKDKKVIINTEKRQIYFRD